MKSVALFRFTFLFTIICSVACSEKAPPAPDTVAGSGLKVGKVVVTYDEAVLAEDRENSLKKHNTPAQLEEWLKKSLSGLYGIYDSSGDLALEFEITEHRLRHGATFGLTGLWSGPDRVGGHAKLLRGSTVLASFDELAAGQGGAFEFKQETRLDNVVRELSRRITHKIAKTVISDFVQTGTTLATSGSDAVDKNKEHASQAKVESALSHTSSGTRESCSVDQILQLKKTGLSDAQIKAACAN